MHDWWVTVYEPQKEEEEKVMKHVYIAGPYRGKTAWEVEQNIRRAEEVAFKVAECGHVPVCPHSMYRYFNGELTDQFWLDGTISLLSRCDVMVVLSGYENSEGTKEEIAFAQEHGIPVFKLGFEDGDISISKLLD